MGDVIGDINSASRPDPVDGRALSGAKHRHRRLVPLSEMFGYVGDLRSARLRVVLATACSSTRTPRCRKNVAEEIVKKARGE